MMAAARSVAFLAASLLMLMTWGCTDIPQSEQTPTDGNGHFFLEYVSQGTYDAFPLGIPHADTSFESAGMDLDIWENPNHPLAQRIPVNPNDATNLLLYMIDKTKRLSGDESAYQAHVIAIAWFTLDQDTTIADTLTAGWTMDFSVAGYEETVSFVCVGLLNYTYLDSDNKDEAVSGTTVHELGHNATTSDTYNTTIRDCLSDPPQSHNGTCVMMDLAEIDGELRAVCGLYNYPYTYLFCSNCVDLLKSAASGQRKL